MPIIFCNVGWMERYEGLRTGDQISGGGSFVKREGRGHEICNFAPVRGLVYGYVQPTGNQISIERLGAEKDDEHASGVTVVWTATRPTGGTTVVGWYRNAKVFRSYQKHKSLSKVHTSNLVDGYWIESELPDVHLLSIDERTMEIPRRVKGGMGQSNIWYADAPEARALVRQVERYIESNGKLKITHQTKTQKQDQERKAQVEKAAIQTCCLYYEALGYEVESVEKDNLGWDLVATQGRTTLRIEAKGLSSEIFSIELTPNEFLAFSSNEQDYRLAVVTAALSEPKLHICRHSTESGAWIIEGMPSSFIDIQIRQSASVKIGT
jgi:hypothetical protein